MRYFRIGMLVGFILSILLIFLLAGFALYLVVQGHVFGDTEQGVFFGFTLVGVVGAVASGVALYEIAEKEEKELKSGKKKLD